MEHDPNVEQSAIPAEGPRGAGTVQSPRANPEEIQHAIPLVRYRNSDLIAFLESAPPAARPRSEVRQRD
jgi:hypothetical protein